MKDHTLFLGDIIKKKRKYIKTVFKNFILRPGPLSQFQPNWHKMFLDEGNFWPFWTCLSTGQPLSLCDDRYSQVTSQVHIYVVKPTSDIHRSWIRRSIPVRHWVMSEQSSVDYRPISISQGHDLRYLGTPLDPRPDIARYYNDVLRMSDRRRNRKILNPIYFCPITLPMLPESPAHRTMTMGVRLATSPNLE